MKSKNEGLVSYRVFLSAILAAVALFASADFIGRNEFDNTVSQVQNRLDRHERKLDEIIKLLRRR